MTRDYWLNLIQVSGGVILGQLLGIIGYLFLTWIYGPAEFGAYASWLAIVAIGAVVCTGALETSLVRDADGDCRAEAVSKILWTALLGAMLFAGSCGIALSLLPALLPGSPTLAAVSIAVAVYALATNVVLQSWASAEGAFRSLTVLRIVQSGSIVLVPLALSMTGRTSHQLVWGHTLGLVLAAVAWRKAFRSNIYRGTSLRDLPRFYAARRRCFVYVLPGLLIGALAANLPQLVVNSRFGSEAAGHLALAQRVLGVPLSLIGVAVRDVFRRYASVAFRERGNCIREYWSSFGALAAAACCFVTVMLVFGEELFALVFGVEWRMAGQIAHWLLPMFAVGIIASPLTYLVYIVQREEFDLYWQSALLVVVTLTLLVFPDLFTSLIAFAWSYAAMYVVYLVACARLSMGHVRRE